MAFFDDDLNRSDFWHYLDLSCDFVFMFDLLITSFSAYYADDGNLITSNKKIFFNYLTGWFSLDLIACIPANLVEDVLHLRGQTFAKYN